MIASLVAAGLIAFPSPAAAPQCPDGSPPPCASARRPVAQRPPAAELRARRFLLLPFRNVSRAEREEWLVNGSPLLLADVLGRFRELTVIPDEQVVGVRRRLGIDDAGTLDAAQRRRLAAETGGWTIVSGNIVATGAGLTISAQAVDAVTGTVLKRAEVRAEAGGDLRGAYDELAMQLLEAAGLPPQHREAGLTTRSIDAWRAYARGMTLLYQSSFRRASEAFAEAVAIDSTFAHGWARLALTSSAWNLENLVNPLSPAYRAAARAATLLPQLPPAIAALIRAQQHFMRGQIGAARTLVDSMLSVNPDNVDALEMSAALEMLDPVLRQGTPITRRGSMTLAVQRARRVVELDPGRRYAYGFLIFGYTLAGGMWGGNLPAVMEERGSFASMIGRRSDVVMVHVLRDTFAVMTDSAFRALTATERAGVRRRAADAAQHWVEQFLTAGPGDADAHLWASRVAELRDDMATALRETEIADSLGAESLLENIAGRRLTLLLYALHFERAGAMADSLAARGRLTQPLLATLDRGFASGSLALLASGRFARAAALASAIGPSGTETNQACERLIHPLRARSAMPPPEEIAWVIIDSIVARADAFAAEPVLRPCLRMLPDLREGSGREAQWRARIAAVEEALSRQR